MCAHVLSNMLRAQEECTKPLSAVKAVRGSSGAFPWGCGLSCLDMGGRRGLSQCPVGGRIRRAQKRQAVVEGQGQDSVRFLKRRAEGRSGEDVCVCVCGVEILGDKGTQLSKCHQNGKGGPLFALEGARRVRTPGTLGLAQACCLEIQDAVSWGRRPVRTGPFGPRATVTGALKWLHSGKRRTGLRMVSICDTFPSSQK